MREAVNGVDQHELTLELPQIVGYVPEDERGDFDEAENHSGFLLLGIEEIIRQDLEQLGLVDRYDTALSDETPLIVKEFVRAGEMPVYGDPKDDWHMDDVPFARKAGETVEFPPGVLSYVISNSQPTWFYGGRVRLMTGNLYDTWRIDQEKTKLITSDKSVVGQAAPYAIVRQGPLCLHSRPIVTEDTNRVFMRVSLYPTA